MRKTIPDAPEVMGGWRDRLIAAMLKRMALPLYLWLYREYLQASGWAASARAHAPVDRHGRPIPWYTYAALAFIEPRLRGELEVFEYGAGYSTLWWAARVGHVSSVESELAWVEHLRPKLPVNTDLRHEPSRSTYAASAQHRGRRFDIVVIDGFDRNDCARACREALKDDGIVIWDNADREEQNAEGFEHLHGLGFRRLDFDGLGPLAGRGWRTTVFYRPHKNCLGI